MTPTGRAAALVVVVAGVAGAVALVGRRAPSPPSPALPPSSSTARPTLPPADNPARPRTPPGPGPRDRPPMPPEPVLPRLDEAERAKLAERVRKDPHPGMAAFRVLSERYVDDNAAMAREQAAKEGLTLPEVRELTHFGLLVMATQRVDDVEDLVGHPLGAEARAALSTLMTGADRDFEEGMRALVKRGASEEERWALIHRTEESYLRELYRITGLDERTLDDLLAGNVGLPGAPAAGLPAGKADPDDRGPPDPVTPPARPVTP